jgi:nucleotide-binding universal stress UspA family protein
MSVDPSLPSGGGPPSGAERPYTIVVGVSERSSSPTALQWAVREAAAHGGRVIAVRAWRPTPPQTGSRVNPAPLREFGPDVETAERQVLEADVAAVLGDGHTVETQLVVGGRRKSLVRASRDADLLVVDAPRTAQLSPPPLQLRRLVYGASCPVVVMPPALSGEGRTLLERAGASALRSMVEAAGHAGRPGVRPPSTVSDAT